jgi:hypothetical protein
MTSSERNRRDIEILALAYGGTPARKIALQLGRWHPQNKKETYGMTSRERSRRDTEIAALADGGTPARKIAARFGLSKRQCNRIIAMRRNEREQGAAPSRSEADASPLELLDRMDELFEDARSPATARLKFDPMAHLRADVERRLLWKECRGALENWIADALRAQGADG